MFQCCMKPAGKDENMRDEKATKRLKSSVVTSSMRDSVNYEPIESINAANHPQPDQVSHISSSSKKFSEDTSIYNQNSIGNLMNSGMNTPVNQHHFPSRQAGDKQMGGLAACSLDANNIEVFQKIIEKKQATTQNSINAAVMKIFPNDKMFFLRDLSNKYSTMAYCTKQNFYIAGGPLTHSNGSVVQGNASNLSSQIQMNTNNLFKNQGNQKELQLSGSQNNDGTSMFTNSQLRSTMHSTSTNVTSSTSNQGQNSETQNSFKYQYTKQQNNDFINFTPQRIALHIAETFKKYPLLIDACCGVGGNLIQFQKFNKMVIAVDKNPVTLNSCVENLKSFCSDKGVNVEFVNSDFLSLECGDYGSQRADLVFINPAIEVSSSDPMKSDIFTQSSPNLLRAMMHAYLMSKNIALLLPHHIDLNQIPILLDKFYRCPPYHTVEHFCPHIEIIYQNDNVKYFLIMLGDVSNITQEQELMFLQESIRDRSYYPKGPYEERVMELLRNVLEKTGMKKLVNCVIKGIDLNDLQKQKNLLSTFVDELQKEKILSDCDIKKMLTLNGNQNLQNNGENGAHQEYFELSMLSGQSNFEFDMSYGSKQSNDILDLHNLVVPSPEHENSYDKEHNSPIKYVDSSLGERLEIEDSYDMTFKSQESDFYIDDKNMIPIDGKPTGFLNPNTQINTL